MPDYNAPLEFTPLSVYTNQRLEQLVPILCEMTTSPDMQIHFAARDMRSAAEEYNSEDCAVRSLVMARRSMREEYMARDNPADVPYQNATYVITRDSEVMGMATRQTLDLVRRKPTYKYAMPQRRELGNYVNACLDPTRGYSDEADLSARLGEVYKFLREGSRRNGQPSPVWTIEPVTVADLEYDRYPLFMRRAMVLGGFTTHHAHIAPYTTFDLKQHRFRKPKYHIYTSDQLSFNPANVGTRAANFD